MPVVPGLPEIDGADNDLLDILQEGKRLQDCLWECPFRTENPQSFCTDEALQEDSSENDSIESGSEGFPEDGSEADSGGELEGYGDNPDDDECSDDEFEAPDPEPNISPQDEIRTVVLDKNTHSDSDGHDDSVNIDSLTYAELKSACREYGLVTKGKKAVLQQRLQTYFDNL